MFDLDSIAVDAKKLRGGVIWEIWASPTKGHLEGRPVDAPTDNGCVLVVPIGVEFERALERARQPYLPLIRMKRMTPEDERKVLAEALADAVVKNWWNISRGGQPVAYSREACVDLLASETWTTFRDHIYALAQSKSALLLHDEDDVGKN